MQNPMNSVKYGPLTKGFNKAMNTESEIPHMNPNKSIQKKRYFIYA